MVTKILGMNILIVAIGKMSIFRSKKNTLESGTSNSILNSIENTSVLGTSGQSTTLIWRSPYKDFNTNSVLTVNPGEEAVFIKNGKFISKFGPGRHQLSTQKYPFLSSLRNVLSGGQSTFSCEVYFVRTSISTEVLWGTSSPIQLRDPVQKIQTSIIARGAYKVSVADPFSLITKLISQVDSFDNDELLRFFHHQFQQKIKTVLAKQLQQSSEELLGVCARLEEFSNLISSDIAMVFDEYGLKLNDFSISAMDIPEDDPNRQRLEEAYSRSSELRILNDDYKMIKGMEIMKDIANNEGGGAMAAMGAGMGMGIGAGSAMAEMAKNVFGPSETKQPSNSDKNDSLEKLSQLKEMLNQGLIDNDEFAAMKKKILESFI